MIASLYPETIQICALKSANIKVVSQTKGKRVMLGDKGSGSEFDARNILSAHGITYDMIKPDYVGWEVATQRLKDDQGDMLFQTAGYPASYIIDLTTMRDVNLVSLSDDAIQKLCAQYKFYVPSTIPPKTYKGQDQEVKSIAMMALWVTHDGVPEKLVYDMTKALWEKGKMANRNDQANGAGFRGYFAAFSTIPERTLCFVAAILLFAQISMLVSISATAVVVAIFLIQKVRKKDPLGGAVLSPREGFISRQV